MAPPAKRIDIWNRYRPTTSQARFLNSPAKGRLFSSGYGGGKSKTGCRESIRFAVEYPGSRNGIFRLTAEQLRKTTMVTFWREMGEIGFRSGTQAQVDRGARHFVHNKQDKELRWWNGSLTLYGHLDDEEGLGSLELSSAFVDEGSEVSTSIYQILYGSRLRWHLPVCTHADEVAALIVAGATDAEVAAVTCDCPRRMWVCTNPGESGYLNRVVTEGVDGWEWIAAEVDENPYNGPDYYAQMERLEALHGHAWMERYRRGRWGTFEGQRFTMFDEDTHVIPAFRQTPEHRYVCGWDFGHRETFVSFMAYRPDRDDEPVVVFDEVVVNEVREPSQVAGAVNDAIARWGIPADRLVHMGDPAGTGSSQVSSISPIGAYAELGIHIAPCRAGKNPVDRANLLAKFLVQRKPQADGSQAPGILFVEAGTRRLRKSVVNLHWKSQTSRLGEDPRERFVDKDKHGFDALTYGLYRVPPPDLPKPKPRILTPVNVGFNEVMASLRG